MKKTFVYEKRCAICESVTSEKLFEKGDIFVEICKNCGLIKLNPHYDKKTYDAFYKSEYDTTRSSISSKSKNDELRKDRMIEFFMSLKKTNAKNFSPRTILDIGAGNGLDLECIKDFLLRQDSEFYSIEHTEFCINELNRKNFKVISKDGESNWDKNYKNYFDFINIRNVLEHTLDPISVLKKISNSLSEEGLVFISVPNMSNPDFPLNLFFEIPHTYYFSKNTLRNSLIKSELQPSLIWDDSKVFPRMMYAIAKKAERGNRKDYNFSKEEYLENRKFILNQSRSAPAGIFSTSFS